MDKNKEFINNTLLLFLGKFATQFISLLLLPLYTHYLFADDYGFVDLLQTYISLFSPILIFRIDSAVFRFLIDARKNDFKKKEIISNIIVFLLLSLLFTLILGFIIITIISIKYELLVLLNIIVVMISSVLLQLVRGLGKNFQYSICSIITGVSTLLINIILIVCYNWNASSILISSIIANVLCIGYILFTSSVLKYLDFGLVSKNDLKEIFLYSFPMIPNSLSWWIVNVSDRTIITALISSTMNGIYSVSCKFSNILNSIFSIFNMSWQESASLHINDDDRDQFFTNIINKLFFLFSSASLGIIAVLPFVFNIIIGADYLDAYKYIPFVLYGNVWNVLISLIGGIYVAKKKTKEIANTTMISATINIILNLLLIKIIGLYAACISTMVAYIVMGIYRYIDSKKYVDTKLNVIGIIIFTFVFTISSILYLNNNFLLNVTNLVCVVLYCIYINKNILINIMNLIKNKIKKISI